MKIEGILVRYFSYFPKLIKFSVFFVFFFIPISNLLAQNGSPTDVLYLNNGSIVKGKIIKVIPDDSVSIRNQRGHIYKFDMSRVSKIVRKGEELSDDDSTNNEPQVSETTPNNSFTSNLELNLNAGFGENGGNLGFGGGAALFVPLDEKLSLGVMASYYSFNQTSSVSGSENTVSVSNSTSGTMNYIEGLGALKYNFDLGENKAYIFGGLGIVDVVTSASVSNTMTDPLPPGGTITTISSVSNFQVCPLFSFGCGIGFPIGSDIDLFAQAKESFVLGTVNEETPTSSGVILDIPSNQNYTILEGGINFNFPLANNSEENPPLVEGKNKLHKPKLKSTPTTADEEEEDTPTPTPTAITQPKNEKAKSKSHSGSSKDASEMPPAPDM